MSEVPEGLKYTQDHEWVDAPAGPVAKVGVTAFAAAALGDVVFVDLPQVGDMVTAGAECGEIESTKSVAPLYSPVSGQVVAVNQAVVDAPELVNQDPFGEGWLFTAEPQGEADLLDATAYAALLAETE